MNDPLDRPAIHFHKVTIRDDGIRHRVTVTFQYTIGDSNEEGRRLKDTDYFWLREQWHTPEAAKSISLRAWGDGVAGVPNDEAKRELLIYLKACDYDVWEDEH